MKDTNMEQEKNSSEPLDSDASSDLMSRSENVTRTIHVVSLTPVQYVIVASCLLAIISAPLPWFRARVFETSINLSGIDVNYNTITLILSIVTLFALIWDVMSGQSDKYKVDIYTGILSTGLAITVVTSVALIDGATEAGVSPHIGSILTLICGLLLMWSTFMIKANVKITFHKQPD